MTNVSNMPITHGGPGQPPPSPLYQDRTLYILVYKDDNGYECFCLCVGVFVLKRIGI